MSKILVIEDWREFEKQLDIIDKDYEPVFLIQAIKNALLDHELKGAIQFEAEVDITTIDDKHVWFLEIPERLIPSKLTSISKVNVTIESVEKPK